jgi:eukaryotic-like serine/threonine-protein kinase
MTPERLRQIEELYHSARQRGSGVLDNADPDLRREVQALLDQNSTGKNSTGNLLDRAAFDLTFDATQTQVTAGSQLGPYKIEALLGHGGMGEVFRATDTRLGRSVAIKVSQEQFTDRFEREARAIAALNHPNICTLYDVGPNYLVMELVEGETLAARLKRGKLSFDETIRYGAQIASALAAAHGKDIVHRDLKPGNVMLTKAGVKVLDFGLAKSAQDETLTVANAVMGTPAYMAPEQKEGKPCDARTDIYALGLVLTEMATGTRTRQTGSLPEKLAHVLDRCLAEDPDGRWQSARDVQSELAWAGEPAAAPTPVELPKQPSRLWPVVSGLAILALASALALVYSRESPETPARYATILPPEKTSFDFASNLGPVALSPDGKRMVFGATGEDGKSQLWLRALDTPGAQPLQNTEGGTFPFWSPDSRWVGFFAEGKLKKLDTRGGPTVPLADAISPGAGGSWSSKGIIVFAPTIFAPLTKVSSDGGAASPAVATDVAMGTAHGFPWFLPDGEHFLFASWGGAGHMQLRVGSLSSTASSVIGEADSNALYASGHLLYLRQNSLMKQPFDLKSLRTSGEAVPVAERVERYLNLVEVGAFSASANGLLAYHTGAEAAVRKLTWFDRQGKPSGTLGEPRAFFTIQFSPDQKTLAASAPDAAGNYDLWMYDVARGLPTRFTVDPAGEYWAAFSPDGRTVIFNSTRRQNHYDLYRKPANGAGTEELLYADDTDKVPTSWSHDGKTLLYFTGGGRRFEMFVLPLTPERPGDPLKPVAFHQTQFNEGDAQFSPDDRWVAYNSDESGRDEIYVSPFSRPTEKHQISAGGGRLSRWRKDGKGIFYETPDGQLMAAELRISGETVEVGAVHVLPVGIKYFSGYAYDVSDDGQRILAAMPIGNASQPVTLVENWPAALK